MNKIMFMMIICRNYITYEREFQLMKRKRNQNSNQNFKVLVLSKFNKYFPSLVITICGGICVALCSNIHSTIENLSIQIPIMQNDIDDLQSDLDKFDDLNTNFLIMANDIEHIKEDLEETKDDINEMKNTSANTTKMFPSDYAISKIKPLYLNNEIQSVENEPLISSNIIATDKIGNDYSVEKMVDKKLLLPYRDDGCEVFFLGKYSETNNWDGNCIINVYKNNELISVTDAIYDNGKLLTYEQAFLDYESEQKRWFISSRKNEGNYNSGETKEYEYLKLEQMFEFDNVNVENIINMEQIKKIIESKLQLKAYYNGNTSNGKYNDVSGKAYYINFKGDCPYKNVINVLYVGNFKNGCFNDTSGKAWEIVLDTNNNSYFYYNGNFIKNEREGEVSEKDYISREKRKEIIQEIIFNFDVNWYDEMIESKI